MERNKNRTKEILNILLECDLQKEITPQKLRMVIEKMNIAFENFCIGYANSHSVLPGEYYHEFLKINFDADIVEFEEIKKIIEDSYSMPINDIFSQFSEVPIESNNLFQVHRAVMQNGRRVILKIKKKDIYAYIYESISILKKSLETLKCNTKIGSNMDINTLLDEFLSFVNSELNFSLEQGNIEKFSKLNNNAYFTCQKINYQYSNSDIIVADDDKSICLGDVKGLGDLGVNLRNVANNLILSYAKQTTQDGFFHSCPIASNISINNSQIIWKNLRLFSSLSDIQRMYFKSCIQSILSKNIDEFADSLLALDPETAEMNKLDFFDKLFDLVDKYNDSGKEKISLNYMINEIVDMLNIYKIAIPRNISLFFSSLCSLSKTVEKLDPDIDVIKAISGYIDNKQVYLPIVNESKNVNASVKKAKGRPKKRDKGSKNDIGISNQNLDYSIDIFNNNDIPTPELLKHFKKNNTDVVDDSSRKSFKEILKGDYKPQKQKESKENVAEKEPDKDGFIFNNEILVNGSLDNEDDGVLHADPLTYSDVALNANEEERNVSMKTDYETDAVGLLIGKDFLKEDLSSKGYAKGTETESAPTESIVPKAGDKKQEPSVLSDDINKPDGLLIGKDFLKEDLSSKGYAKGTETKSAPTENIVPKAEDKKQEPSVLSDDIKKPDGLLIGKDFLKEDLSSKSDVNGTETESVPTESMAPKVEDKKQEPSVLSDDINKPDGLLIGKDFLKEDLSSKGDVKGTEFKFMPDKDSEQFTDEDLLPGIDVKDGAKVFPDDEFINEHSELFEGDIYSRLSEHNSEGTYEPGYINKVNSSKVEEKNLQLLDQILETIKLNEDQRNNDNKKFLSQINKMINKLILCIFTVGMFVGSCFVSTIDLYSKAAGIPIVAWVLFSVTFVLLICLLVSIFKEKY